MERREAKVIYGIYVGPVVERERGYSSARKEVVSISLWIVLALASWFSLSVSSCRINKNRCCPHIESK